MSELPIVPPRRGLNDSRAKTDQPPETTSVSLNTRTEQSSTGRLRVGTRNGYVRYNSREIGRNWLAYTEDFSKFRDTFEGDQPFPLQEGWIITTTGAKSFSAVTDGTLAPDGSLAYLCSQAVVTTGAQRAEIGQQFDPDTPGTGLAAKPGSTFLRGAGRLFFSCYMKAGTATQSMIAIRQGLGSTLNQALIVVTWASGVPSLSVSGTLIPTDASYGFYDEGGGWYRVWSSIPWDQVAEGDSANSGSVLRCILRPNNASTAIATTYFWGAQLELAPPGEAEPGRYEPVLGRNEPGGSQKITAITNISHLLRNVDHVRKPAQLSARTSASTPSKQAPQGLAYDDQGNRYVLEPQAVVKYTPGGELVFSVPVPIAQEGHVCQALHVDEAGQIYVGVSSGGDSTKAKLFCFRQGPAVEGGRVREDAYHLHWTVDTARYVIAITSKDGVLYTLQDDPVRARSELVTYSQLDFATPDVELRRPSPYPSRGFAVKQDGSVVTCHGTNATRGLDPSAGSSDANGPWPPAVGWTPMANFSDWQRKCWAFIDAEAIDGRPTVDNFANEDEVTEWTDLTGKQRNLYKPTGVAAPFVDLKGTNGIPGVRFRGGQGLQSNPNPGTDPSAKDLLRTLFPSYDGAKFTAYLVFRPTFQATQGAVIGQALINDTSPAQDAYYVVGANRGASNTIANAVRGVVSLFDHADGTVDAPASFGNHPDDAMVESGDLMNFVVMTIQCGTATDESQVRINGALANRGAAGVKYASKAVAGQSATSLGYFAEAAGFGSFDGVFHSAMLYDELHSQTDIELHEGYFANRFGGQGRLAAAHPYAIVPASTLLVPSKAPVATGKADPNLLNHRKTILAKFAPGGELKWAAVNYSGVGFDVATDPAGNLICFGEYDASEATTWALANRGRNGWLRKVLDLGDSANPDDLVADWCQNLCRSGTSSVSNLFSDAFWTKTNVTVGAAVTDPFGGSSALTLTTTVAGGTVRHDFVTADLYAGGQFTASIYLKAGTAATSRLRLLQQGGTAVTQIDVTHATGAVTPGITTTTTPANRVHRFKSEDGGNGWRRVQVTLDFQTADSTTLRFELLPDISGTGSVLAYGAMLERNASASTFAYSATQAKHHEPPSSLSSNYPRIAVDKFGNVFVPGPWPAQTATVSSKTVFSMRVYDALLHLVHDLDVGTIVGNTLVPGRAVVANPDPPEYATSNPGRARNLLGYTQRILETNPPISIAGASSQYWTRTDITTTPAKRIAPDGSVTADTLDDSNAATVGALSLDVDGLDDGADYTFSVYLAPQDALNSRVTIEHALPGAGTVLALAWSTVSGRAPSVVRTEAGAGVHNYSVSVEANGFSRVSVSCTYQAALGALRLKIEPDTDASSTKAVSAWGLQLEEGMRATPYQAAAGRYQHEPSTVPEPVGVADTCTLVTLNDTVGSTNKPQPTIHEVTLVEERPNGLPARDQKLCAVRRGSFFTLSRFGEARIPRGGSSCLDIRARYVSMATLYQRVVAVDGRSAVVYQPTVDGRVRAFKATKGTFPERVQLVASYRGRMLAARTTDDPHFWAASAIEDIFDWDYSTPPPRSDQAVFATTCRAGKAPDAINCFFPYRDQTLFAGCDSSIWYLPGDPLGAATEWQEVSRTVGVSWGDKAVCEDDKGNIFFFGSRGGLWTLSPGGPRPLTEETIERRLTNIDLSTHYVELAWNWRSHGLHIFVIPFGTPGVIVKHYHLGLRNMDWREDEFADVLLQPTASTVLDGDEPNDRRLLLVNGRGNVLQWSEDTWLDDGVGYTSKERIGPYGAGANDALWRDPRIVMSEDTTAADFRVYAARDAGDAGAAKASGTLGPGRNPRKLVRARGAKFWLEIGSTTPGARWAFEEGVVEAFDQGGAKLL